MALILAPMEGLLDSTLRDLLTRFGGVDWCVSEFIRVTGSVLPKRTFLRLLPELASGCRTPSGTPIRAQLLGSDPAFTARNASRLADLGPHGIDINFGCPARTVNRHGGGAALLDSPSLMESIVAAVRKAVPHPILVSAKMRLGVSDDSRAIECAKAIEAGGASELVVHARTKTQGYQPPAHWHRIRDIQDAVRLRVIANGDIWTVEDALQCKAVSGCTDLMLGRGMVSDPGLARAIRYATSPPEDPREEPLPSAPQPVQWQDLVPALFHLWNHNAQTASPGARAGRLKQWLLHLKRRFPEAASLFLAIRSQQDPDAITRILRPDLSSP